MRNIKSSLKNKIKKELSNSYYFYRFKMPARITWISLYLLIFILISKREFEIIYTISLIIIGITVTISQTCFAYLETEKDKKIKSIILRAGKHLLASSVWLSIALLITFLSVQFKTSKFSQIKFLQGLNLIFDVLALLHFTYAADSINKGLHRIGYILFWKVDI